MKIQCWHLSQLFPAHHILIWRPTWHAPLSQSPKIHFQCIFARKFDPTSSQIGRHTVRPHFAKSCSFPVLTLAEFFHLTSLTLCCGENILAFPASPPPTGQSWVELWGDTSTQRKRCSRCKRRLLPLFNLCPLHSLSSSSILVIYPKSSLSQLNLMVEHNTGSKLGLEDWQALSQVRTGRKSDQLFAQDFLFLIFAKTRISIYQVVSALLSDFSQTGSFGKMSRWERADFVLGAYLYFSWPLSPKKTWYFVLECPKS